MAKKGFLLRIDETVLNALKRWADDDLRSLNGQMEFLLRKALADHRRLSREKAPSSQPDEERAQPEG